jgi:uncharacterized DUF497 family protein
MLRFDWSRRKARTNLSKHGVSFEEALTVFMDEHATRFFDREHAEDEDRFILLGLSVRLRLLVVCQCERDDGKLIRVISARRATARESAHYRGALR